MYKALSNYIFSRLLSVYLQSTWNIVQRDHRKAARALREATPGAAAEGAPPVNGVYTWTF